MVGFFIVYIVINYYIEFIVVFFIVDIVINYYIEFIEVFFIVDIVRYCYIEYVVDRIYYIRFICFLIDIWKL